MDSINSYVEINNMYLLGYNQGIERLLKKTEKELYNKILQNQDNMGIATGLSVSIRIMNEVANKLKEEKIMEISKNGDIKWNQLKIM